MLLEYVESHPTETTCLDRNRDGCHDEPVTRVKQAWIALYVVALANVGLIAVSWPRAPKLTEIATLTVCGGAVLLTYREDPAQFHRRVGRAEAARMLLLPVLMIGATVLVATTHLL